MEELERACGMFEAAFGPEDHEVGRTLVTLAAGQSGEARRSTAVRAQRILEQQLGAAHPATVKAAALAASLPRGARDGPEGRAKKPRH